MLNFNVMYEKVINNVEFKCKNKITFEVIFYLKKEKISLIF